MKRRWLVALILLVCVLSLSSAAYAQRGPGPIISAGGGYRLSPATAAWRVSGSAGGGGYQMDLDAPAGCCCKTFMPCVKK